MTPHIPTVRPSRPFGYILAAVTLMAASVAIADTDAPSITLDKSTYSRDQIGHIQINIPEPMRLEWKFYLYIKEAGESEYGWTLRDCGDPLIQGKDRNCEWHAPSNPGVYEMTLLTAGPGSKLLAKAGFRVVGAEAAPAATGSGVTITLDKKVYVAGQTGSMRIGISPNLRSDLAEYSFVKIREAGSAQDGQWLKRCGWPLANGADGPCDWDVPTAPGEMKCISPVRQLNTSIEFSRRRDFASSALPRNFLRRMHLQKAGCACSPTSRLTYLANESWSN